MIVMGITSILMQITVLRQLITVFAGNELVIGITLSVWLTAAGIGSFTGHRFRGSDAFAWSFLFVALLSQPTVVCTNLIRLLFQLEFGETIPLPSTIISTIAILFPLCFVIGMQFPLAVSYAQGKSADVYSREAAGAFSGGILFTILLSGKVDAYVLTAAISAVNLVILIVLLRKKYLLILLLIPIVFYFGSDRLIMMLQWKGAQLIEKVESRYGEILVLKMKEQVNVFASGKLQFSYPDPQAEELKIHLPMSVHPAPQQVLVLGGSLSLLRELTKYPLSRVDFVEIDPQLIAVSARLLVPEDSMLIKNKQLSIITKDARKFVKSLHIPDYDLVVMNLPEPATANINRFYTTEFFTEIKAVLKENGILSLTLPTSSGYIGRKLRMANGSVFNSLKKIFTHVAVTSEEYGYYFASTSPINIHPQMLETRFLKRGIQTSYFKPYILHDAFSPLKVDMVRARLEKVDTANSDLQPVAYLYNLMLWSEVHGGSGLNQLLALQRWQVALPLSIVLFALFLFLWGKKQAVYFSLFTTGYATLAFSLVLLLTYQAFYGYIYEMIGLLTASFMLGMAWGAYAIKGVKNPLRLLKLLELVAISIFISAPLFFRWEILFYGINFLCGMTGGMQFATATLCLRGQETTKTAGRLYAADLTGSFLGAFATSLLLMPLFGVQKTLLFLVLIKGMSVILLVSVRHEKS